MRPRCASGRCAAWLGLGVQASRTCGDPRLECGGQVQPVRDARQDQRDIQRAEAVGGTVECVDAALAERAGEVLAVVDELADQTQELPGAAEWRGKGTAAASDMNVSRTQTPRNVKEYFRKVLSLRLCCPVALSGLISEVEVAKDNAHFGSFVGFDGEVAA